MDTTTGNGPDPTPRRLRAELRDFRVQHSLSSSDAAARLGWPRTKLADIENGHIAVSPADLADLLELYGIHAPEQVQALQDLARTDRERMWWDSYRPSIPDAYLDAISAESDATRITHFHPTVLPGLLQTRSYATSLTAPSTLKATTRDVVEARIDARMRRQREVLHRADPAKLTALLDETVLRRRIGSDATMREQLDHLAHLMESGIVTVIVVGPDAGPHPGLLGAFMILEYDDARLDDVLVFEGALGNTIVRDSPKLAKGYRKLADWLIRIGICGQAAVRLIQSARENFT